MGRRWFRGLLAGVAAVALCSELALAEPYDVGVIIANRQYRHQDVPEVRFAKRDGDAIELFFKDVLGIPAEQIIRLDDATRSDFHVTFGVPGTIKGSELWARVREGKSRVWVYYSGHGVPGLDDGEGYLLPSDAAPAAGHLAGYGLPTLYANLQALDALSVTVLIDACFSGTSQAGPLIQGSLVGVRVAPAPAPKDFRVLTAAGPTEVASWDVKAGHGLFTEYLLRGVYGAADAKEAGGNGDQAVTLAELAAYLGDEVYHRAKADQRREQRPTVEGDRSQVMVKLRPGLTRPALPDAAKPAPELEKPVVAALPLPEPPMPEAIPVPVAPTPEAIEASLSLTRDDRVLVQKSLEALGHDPRGTDGSLGPRSRSAISGWQAGKSESVTGYLTATQHGRLLAEAAPKLAAPEAARVVESPKSPIQPVVGIYGDSASRPGEEFDDCGGAGWCPKLRVVPSGRFEQGATSAERAWYLEQGGSEKEANSEQPRHGVTIGKSFAMGKQEVTMGQFRRFVEQTGHKAEGGCWIWTGGQWKLNGGRSWRDPGFGQTEDHPVVCVSWEDAKAYVAWLSKETGKGYRLPSESEWEYAARGSTSPTIAMRYWGDDKGNSEACSYANAADITSKEKLNFAGTALSCRDGEVYTARASRYRANGFGLHDMLGNVWEWVEDPWHDSYAGAPTDGSVWKSGGSMSSRIIRGGSWNYFPGNLRSAVRGKDAADSRNFIAGFRVARTLAP